MKLNYLAILTLSCASVLGACQTTSNNAQHTKKEASVVNNNTSDVLKAYTWAYQPSNTNRPIVLSFLDNNHLSIQSGCNGLGATWSLKNNQLITDTIMGTMMGCEPALMAQERFASALFQKREIAISIDTKKANQPILTIEAADGQKYQFIGTETPETKYQGKAELVFLEVASQTKPCTGVAPQQCLQVREIKYDGQGLKTSTGEWQLFYGQIEGFEHNPDYRSVLRLKRFTLKNPAADQSKYVYVHDMTVEQEAVK